MPLLVGLAAVGGFLAWRSLNAGLDPALPADFDAVDAEVADLLRSKVEEVEADRSSGRKHGSLGLAYEANSMWPEATRAFANAAELDAGEPLWAYHQARAMINSGDQEGGFALLSQVAPGLPGEPGVQLYFAHQLLDAGEYDEAQTALNHVVRLLPDRAEGYAGQGELLLAREDYAGAVSVLRRALDLDPGLTIAHYSLGLAYRGVGDLDQAEKELGIGLGATRQGIADKFGAETQGYGVNYVGVINTSSDLIEAGEYKAALEMLERLRKTRPDDTNMLNNLGIVYMRQENFAKAFEHLLHANEIDDTFFGTHQNLAACYRDTGDLEKALFHAERSVALGGDVASTHFGLTRILARLGRFDEALVSARTAARLDPDDATKHAAVGELLANMRQPREARKSFQMAVDLSPSFLPPRLNLIRILIGLGEMQQAEAVLRAGEELAPDNPQIQECRRLYEDARRRRAAGGRNG